VLDYSGVEVVLEQCYIAFTIVSADGFVFLESYEIFLCSSVVLSEEFQFLLRLFSFVGTHEGGGEG